MSLRHTLSERLSPVILLVLVAMLAPTSSAAASASQAGPLVRRLPSPRQFRRDPGALASAFGATSPRGSFFGPDGSNAVFEFEQKGSPYEDWYVQVLTERGKAALEIETIREQSTHDAESYQVYVWSALLPATDVHVGPRLQSFSIHTGSDLGAHGSIDLHLGSSSVRSRVVRCHKTGKKLAVESHGRGQLEGDFSFRPGASFLPSTIEQTSVTANMRSTHSTHNHCGAPHPRGNSRSHFVIHCSSEKFLTATDGDGNTLTAVLIRHPFFYLFHRGGTVGLVHSFSYAAVEGPQDIVRLDDGALTVDGSRVGPLFDGSITFMPTGSESVRGPKGCERHDVQYAWYGGTLNTNFDAGGIALHGSGLAADVMWTGHAIGT